MTWAPSGLRSEVRTGWLLLTAQGFHVGLAVALVLNALTRIWVDELSLPTFVTTVPSIDVIASISVVVLTTTYLDRWSEFRRTSVRSPVIAAATIFVGTQLVCLLAVTGGGYPQTGLMPLVLFGSSVAAILSCVPRMVLWLPMLVLAYGWLRSADYIQPKQTTVWTVACLLFVSSAAVYVGSAVRRSRR